MDGRFTGEELFYGRSFIRGERATDAAETFWAMFYTSSWKHFQRLPYGN